jgi:hypothetical protein
MSKQHVELSYDEPKLPIPDKHLDRTQITEGLTPLPFTALTGLMREVPLAPTHVPTNVEEQIVLARISNGSGGFNYRLYVYFPSEPAWKYASLT